MSHVTQKELIELFVYDKDTGFFVRKVKTAQRTHVGQVVGRRTKNGRLVTEINNKSYLLHRLAWLYVYGVWPKFGIDHKNGEPSDNRISNLREATNQQNMQNQRRPQAGGTSKYLGVSFHKGSGKWRAVIQHNKKLVSLGLHCTEEIAHGEYLKAKRLLHEFCMI